LGGDGKKNEKEGKKAEGWRTGIRIGEGSVLTKS